MADYSVPEAKAELVRLRNKGSERTAAENRTFHDLQKLSDAGFIVTAGRDYTPPKKKGFFSW